MAELKAILWDMDGTLVDSEPSWTVSQIKMMNDAGIHWTAEHGEDMVGNPLPVSAQVLRDGGLDFSVPEIVEMMIDAVLAELRGSMPWQPGMRRLLLESKAAGIRAGLVTMSYARVAAPLLEDVPDVFDAVVTGDVVTNGKPDPEPYLTAMQMLGVRPEECLAVEDSLPGVASAFASGAVVIAAERHIQLGDTDHHHLLTDFEPLSIEDLRRLHAEGCARLEAAPARS